MYISNNCVTFILPINLRSSSHSSHFHFVFFYLFALFLTSRYQFSCSLCLTIFLCFRLLRASLNSQPAFLNFSYFALPVLLSCFLLSLHFPPFLLLSSSFFLFHFLPFSLSVFIFYFLSFLIGFIIFILRRSRFLPFKAFD
jgi:hypothetical protein